MSTGAAQVSWALLAANEVMHRTPSRSSPSGLEQQADPAATAAVGLTHCPGKKVKAGRDGVEWKVQTADLASSICMCCSETCALISVICATTTRSRMSSACSTMPNCAHWAPGMRGQKLNREPCVMDELDTEEGAGRAGLQYVHYPIIEVGF